MEIRFLNRTLRALAAASFGTLHARRTGLCVRMTPLVGWIKPVESGNHLIQTAAAWAGKGFILLEVPHRFRGSLKLNVARFGPRVAKIFNRRVNNIEAYRRGAGGNGHRGDAFSALGQGAGVNFPFPNGCVLNDNARRTRSGRARGRIRQTEWLGKAFHLDRPHPAFCERIQVWTAGSFKQWIPSDANTSSKPA